jgi:undecaprenyl pyrophosphate phosphatase UppP
MVDTPKRSVGETITQLLVIAILIAILIGAVIILRQYVESHNTSHSIANEPTFRFTCCAGFNPAVVYHPGVSRGTG